MTKYIEIFDKACNALEKKYKKAQFCPTGEYDVVGFLYQECLRLLKLKNVNRIHIWQRGIDITIGRPHCNQKQDAAKIKVIAEVKVKRSHASWKQRLKGYNSQIRRLKRFLTNHQKSGTRNPRLVVFDLSGTSSKQEEKWAKGSLKKNKKIVLRIIKKH